MGALSLAAKQNIRFSVYVTESRPDCSGLKTAQELQELGIPCKVVLDAAIGFIMEKVDLVLVGAEGVVENGGLINKKNSPTVDYTPPEYINFLFTDLGIFTPAAVSDELIKFYLD
ncbi:Translation initiation factor eIF-2B subunit alpha [Smittium culicis]|uniref:Translation initiation factor eIF-2B subunit alpha n=1 Tax=Smittium culicis TaxID=133412 RepID=A0A1R1YPZ2_9FUNG|nr:Translation initiation factor eIF-2B subunit alpha [Smittium culicis]